MLILVNIVLDDSVVVVLVASDAPLQLYSSSGSLERAGAVVVFQLLQVGHIPDILPNPVVGGHQSCVPAHKLLRRQVQKLILAQGVGHRLLVVLADCGLVDLEDEAAVEFLLGAAVLLAVFELELLDVQGRPGRDKHPATRGLSSQADVEQ